MLAANNPFSSGRLEAIRYRFGLQSTGEAAAALDELIIHLRDHEYCGAIVGPHGSGKTTLLLSLELRLTELGFQVSTLRFNAESSGVYFKTRKMIGDLAQSAILIIDGAEQLGRFAWTCLRKQIERRKRVIVSAHTDGLLPTIFRCVPDQAVVSGLAAELIGGESKELESLVTELYLQHNGNARNVFWALYDKAADGII